MGRKTRIVSLIWLSLIPLAGTAVAMKWPALPKECFVASRPATPADVKRGCAVFLIGGLETSADTPLVASLGTPLDIKIPQYAWHVDQKSGKKTPVIVIQAEESSGIKTVGYRELDSQSFGAALLNEMILLGSQGPEK